MRCTERAYAKINLTLDVGAKRADGYHEITSVMQRISLWDTVTVERGTGCDSLLCSVPVTEDINDNLCMKALRVFFAETAMESGGVSITLEKHIPTQAGLGGGSSDAAAVLLALRTLYAPRMTDMRLERLAEKLYPRRHAAGHRAGGDRRAAAAADSGLVCGGEAGGELFHGGDVPAAGRLRRDDRRGQPHGGRRGREQRPRDSGRAAQQL